MPRYVQKRQPDGTFKLVEVGPRVRGLPRLQFIGTREHQNFRSNVDGSIIQSGRQMKEHMARHGVVHQGEFGPNNGEEYFARKAAERAKYFTGEAQAREIRKDVELAVEKLQHGYKPKPPERMKEDE